MSWPPMLVSGISIRELAQGARIGGLKRASIYLGTGTGYFEPESVRAALVHCLEFLHLDGKFDSSRPDEVAARVRSRVTAIIGHAR